MLEKLKKYPISTLFKDDPLVKVLGNEHHGRVRGMGIWVTPSAVVASTNSKETILFWKNKVLCLGQQLAALIKFVMSTHFGSGQNIQDAHVSNTINASYFSKIYNNIMTCISIS